jgi:hypothetical protein
MYIVAGRRARSIPATPPARPSQPAAFPLLQAIIYAMPSEFIFEFPDAPRVIFSSFAGE